jgi:hypothetical protein
MGSFINRPMLNFNRPELNLDYRVYLTWSPTRRKNYLTTSKYLKNDSNSRKGNYLNTNRLNDIFRNNGQVHDKDSVEYFQRG